MLFCKNRTKGIVGYWRKRIIVQKVCFLRFRGKRKIQYGCRWPSWLHIPVLYRTTVTKYQVFRFTVLAAISRYKKKKKNPKNPRSIYTGNLGYPNYRHILVQKIIYFTFFAKSMTIVRKGQKRPTESIKLAINVRGYWAM